MRPSEAFWHDLEHSGYVADLPVWLDLAESSGGVTVELGCGTGRVTNFLASNGIPVIGVDRSSGLLTALRARMAPGANLTVLNTDILSDWRPPAASIVIAPAMFLQTVGPEAIRLGLMTRLRRSLEPGSVVAISLVEGLRSFGTDELRALASERCHINGIRCESRVVAMRRGSGRFEMVRERRASGQLTGTATQRLWPLSASDAVAEARAAGLSVNRAIEVRETGRHGPMTVLELHAD